MTDSHIKNAQDLIQALGQLSDLQDDPKRCAAEKRARARQEILTKPEGSLGRMEELAIWLSAWQGRERPSLDRATCLVFAGNHGIAAQGVSAYPPEVTGQMVLNFDRGGAAINQLCRTSGADLQVISLDLDRPTQDLSLEAAMTEQDCADAFNRGQDAVPKDADILLLGEMGIGNSTSAAALSTACFGGHPKQWTGAGTGLKAPQIKHKINLIEQAMACHAGKLTSAFEVMRRLGGREMAALSGAVFAARQRSIPVLLDGYICSAAAAVLTLDAKGALDHCQIAHLSREPGHRILTEALGKDPLLDLGMRLGEASGAAVALMILRAAVEVHNGMATFAEAGVSQNGK